MGKVRNTTIVSSRKAKMKTQEEIKKEIEALKAVRPKVRPHSIFGDDNLVQLDAQVEVLEGDLSNGDIYNKYDHAGADENALEAALYARQWIEDDIDPDDGGLAEQCPLRQEEN